MKISLTYSVEDGGPIRELEALGVLSVHYKDHRTRVAERGTENLPYRDCWNRFVVLLSEIATVTTGGRRGAEFILSSEHQDLCDEWAIVGNGNGENLSDLIFYHVLAWLDDRKENLLLRFEFDAYYILIRSNNVSAHFPQRPKKKVVRLVSNWFNELI